MAYTRFHEEWANLPATTTPVTAEALEHIEGGIVQASQDAEAAQASAGALLEQAPANPMAFGAVGDGFADDAAPIANALAAAISRGVDLVLPAGKTFATSSQIVLDSPVRVSGYGATLLATGGATALRISSSNVTVEGLRIVGTGAGAYQAGERGILSLGTAEAPFTNVRVVDVEITGMGDTAIRCDWWVDSVITRCRLHDLAYAGILAMSCQNLKITDCTVEDVWQHDQAQSYGISITDNVNTVEGRSRDCLVQGCTVKNVANWLGMGTHGGERISFVGNRVLGCYRGITFVAGNPERVVTAWSGLAVGNTVDGGSAGGSAGIAVAGQSTGAASTVMRSGNLVTRHAVAYEASVNGYWLEDVAVLGSDAGFPVAATAITAETVVDRVTLPPSPFARKVHVTAAVYATSSDSTNRNEVRIYAGSSVIGRTRRGLGGSGLPEAIPATGYAVIEPGTSPVAIETRVAVNSGSGTLTTSIGSNLTTTAVTVARA